MYRLLIAFLGVIFITIAGIIGQEEDLLNEIIYGIESVFGGGKKPDKVLTRKASKAVKVAFVFFLFLGGLFGAVAAIEPLSEKVIESVSSIPTLIPTQPHLPQLETSTSIFISTRTVVTTSNALSTEISAPSPYISDTPTNTSTPTVSPTPMNVLFEDNFDNGYKDEWEVYGGEPQWVDGKITSNSFTWMIVGDPSWKNYIVEFDVSNNGQGAGNIVGVRIQDKGNMMGLIFGGGAVWAEFKNGLENRFANTDFVVDSDPFHFKIIVQGNNYTVEGKKSFGYKSYQQGKIGFRIHPGVLFDNFGVVQLP